ncbi:hypothetical protein OSTOST_04719, partial [Ostertagia ostertagi]
MKKDYDRSSSIADILINGIERLPRAQGNPEELPQQKSQQGHFSDDQAEEDQISEATRKSSNMRPALFKERSHHLSVGERILHSSATGSHRQRNFGQIKIKSQPRYATRPGNTTTGSNQPKYVQSHCIAEISRMFDSASGSSFRSKQTRMEFTTCNNTTTSNSIKRFQATPRAAGKAFSERSLLLRDRSNTHRRAFEMAQ